MLFERRAAGFPAAMETQADDHVIPGVDELLRVHANLRCLGKLSQKCADPLVPAMDTRPGIVRTVPPLDPGSSRLK